MIKANFNDYKLCNELLKAISMLNFRKLTKVQEQVIPIALEEKDIVVKSKTGSGKTASYAIPVCQLVDWEENKPQALVLTPTRELAIQVKEDFFNIGRFKRLKVAAIYGKSPFYDQEKELKQKTHIVVGTPGRIIDHIEKGTFDLSKIKYLIIDEADEMLNMGFVDQIETIIKSLSKERMTMLLSATMPKDIETLCNKYMKDPIHIEIEDQNKAADNICQERYNVNERNKIELLRDITILENPDSCMIFCNTKQKVDEVYKELAKLQYNCRKIHGGMEQSDRLRVMNNFKLGYFRYLIATDVAARGIDIDNITHVINYDIPEDKESYVHRIGRTGRAGKMGRAITFVTQNESKFLNDIHEYIGKEILLKERPKVETINNLKEEFALKMNTRPEIKETKGEKLSKEIMKLHINAGKKTKMRAVDIVGTLCNIEGMTKDDIGIINIVDISTFVEILNNKGEWVFQQLQKTPIKGRLRTVSKVDI
ncbi:MULTISPECIES: DEAD/DEAH box helicase [Clostridium]|jgi:superfamily II DNA/RNA helicase|uniref:ATP-dependent RNA helicase DbpA n=1 Tax=Clostridium beijerinckii TaxID=1520 RepID=A0AAW3W3A9_CLOBE|nr:DEAD/DEAH box helicase [Clostridium beijerinckii]MBC2456865.1 DEAD/DEAH box helicase [Clostridium beijerinckii]MBC2473395.1 DEAD/DEAH box helicase [Clostridium beijerinckii]MCI1580721.1 DEAD/DEAH box helicase [Clostridium beijerinckii]MCI1583445.1 DEAD/DEAH box helicase [Clostridium beijerinckii]MCI1623651.1 DEAD/DEAH box helicase [Clostridium beijerinckii]